MRQENDHGEGAEVLEQDGGQYNTQLGGRAKTHAGALLLAFGCHQTSRVSELQSSVTTTEHGGYSKGSVKIRQMSEAKFTRAEVFYTSPWTAKDTL